MTAGLLIALIVVGPITYMLCRLAKTHGEIINAREKLLHYVENSDSPMYLHKIGKGPRSSFVWSHEPEWDTTSTVEIHISDEEKNEIAEKINTRYKKWL